MNTLLEVNGLVVHREGRQTLDVPHLAVRRGDVLAAVGPNGAGKTTFFLAAARLLPYKGRLLLDGVQADTIKATEYRRRLALVMQEPLLFDASVRRNVELGLRFRRLPRAESEPRVSRWLTRLGIDHLANRPARKLSGGEAQRVSLARAFVLEPELLLLDEPFSGLDNVTRRRLLADLGRLLSETGTTAIFITHELEEAVQIATHVAVFLQGRVCQAGTVADVLAHPGTPEVEAFLGTVGRAEQAPA